MTVTDMTRVNNNVEQQLDDVLNTTTTLRRRSVCANMARVTTTTLRCYGTVGSVQVTTK